MSKNKDIEYQDILVPDILKKLETEGDYKIIINKIKKFYCYRFKNKKELKQYVDLYFDCQEIHLPPCSEERKKELELLGDISTWDVSQVKDMSYIFFDARRPLDLSNIDLSKWDVSNVENMEGMFYGVSEFNDKTTFKNWDIKKVKDMSYMFAETNREKYGDWLENIITEWEPKSLVNMERFTGENDDASIYGDNQIWATGMGMNKGYNLTNERDIWGDRD
tara:strand:- start:924 stop:1586 length:663 start_codon:yes stop_codon:yes gene_type:complete